MSCLNNVIAIKHTQMVILLIVFTFLPDPGVSGVRSMGPGLSMYLRTAVLWNFADADDDTN